MEFYYEFSLKGKNGKERKIQSPKADLKFIQNRIRILLARIQTPEFLLSSRKGISNIDNAKFHSDKTLRCFDIEKFFNRVSEKYIYIWLNKHLRVSDDKFATKSCGVKFTQ
ncbi:MAG: hypothetical protein LBD98_00450 [Endomicrobium sp.]|jgi:hypothetical protein|nr:hypothetical protein [Endomicrobium sp.]